MCALFGAKSCPIMVAVVTVTPMEQVMQEDQVYLECGLCPTAGMGPVFGDSRSCSQEKTAWLGCPGKSSGKLGMLMGLGVDREEGPEDLSPEPQSCLARNRNGKK